jgi:hypothetical protein
MLQGNVTHIPGTRTYGQNWNPTMRRSILEAIQQPSRRCSNAQHAPALDLHHIQHYVVCGGPCGCVNRPHTVQLSLRSNRLLTISPRRRKTCDTSAERCMRGGCCTRVARMHNLAECFTQSFHTACLWQLAYMICCAIRATRRARKFAAEAHHWRMLGSEAYRCRYIDLYKRVVHITPFASMAEELMKEMDAIAQYLAAQSCIPGVDAGALRQAQAVATCSKIAQLPSLSVTDAAALTGKVQSSVVWQPDQKVLLATAISNKYAAAATGKAPAARKASQTCAQFNNYCTQGDWTVLQDTTVQLQTKVDRIVTRMMMVGLTHPTEQTSRHIVAIIIARGVGDPTISSQSKYNILQGFKTAHTAAKKRAAFKFQHIVNYPIAAADLPADVVAHAYHADPPIAHEIDQLACLANHIPLRSSSASVDSVANTHKARPLAPAVSPMGEGPNPMMNMFAGYMMQMMQQMSNQSGMPARAPGGAHAAISGSREETPQPQRAIENGSVADAYGGDAAAGQQPGSAQQAVCPAADPTARDGSHVANDRAEKKARLAGLAPAVKQESASEEDDDKVGDKVGDVMVKLSKALVVRTEANAADKAKAAKAAAKAKVDGGGTSASDGHKSVTRGRGRGRGGGRGKLSHAKNSGSRGDVSSSCGGRGRGTGGGESNVHGSVSIEWTRSQVMARRTGGGPGSTRPFTFGKNKQYKTEPAASLAARAWLATAPTHGTKKRPAAST